MLSEELGAAGDGRGVQVTLSVSDHLEFLKILSEIRCPLKAGKREQRHAAIFTF